MLKLKVKLFDSRAKLPEVAHEGEDFGFDVFACIPQTDDGTGEYMVVNPGEQKLIPVGFAAEVEDFVTNTPPTPSSVFVKAGLIAKQPSGLALKRMLDVKAGVIDAGYRNEIKILLYNYGKQPQIIKHHDKIAQLVPMPVYTGKVEQVEELSDSARGTAGWGSGHKDTSVKPCQPLQGIIPAWNNQGEILCDHCNDIAEDAKCAVDQPCGFQPPLLVKVPNGRTCDSCKKVL